MSNANHEFPSGNTRAVKSIMSNTEIDIMQKNQEMEKENVPTTTWQKFMRALEVPHQEKPLSALRNPDLEPILIKERTWGFWSFFAYWGLPNFAVATFSTGSALLALDLNIQQSIGSLVIANVLIAVYTIMNSNPGVKYHIGYTLSQRMIFGIYGSYIGIIIRVGISVVLYGYQGWLGGLCINMVFDSFSSNYLNMKNTFPESVPMARKDLIGFLCFQLIQIPFAFVRPSRVNIPSIVTCFMTLFSIIGMLAYLVQTNGGPGPLYYEKVLLSSSKRSWMWLYSMTIWYSGISPAVANQSDYSRFSSGTLSCYLGLFIGIVLPGTFVSLAGMLCASACKGLYGSAYWTPNEIVEEWLNNDYSSKARAAAFFIGISFTGSQVFLNLTQNGYACGMDLAGIFPRYIDVTRGTLFAQLISWVVQPWTFFNTSSSFLNAMSSFGIFVTPIMTLNIIEFYWIRKSKITLIDFFTLSKKGAYWYSSGFNWKSISCLLIGVALGIPGLVYQSQPDLTMNSAMMNYYYGYMFFIPLVTGVLYCGLTYMFPDHHEKMCHVDPLDFFNCFSDAELQKLGMLPFEENLNDICEYLDAEEPQESKDRIIVSGEKKYENTM
ncbi:LANO_0G18426g1_1 [Lachancea nothofagi CBS 11611]|uniref:LANO_0G18426g1_1 n=1 Tax=Lachancea nothofagi CBS 11611 TaxID=1266666 RepID=A0A1G4KKL4_9SACH|nr:LANO_0G18426g1_1 [Lachancea nothofagi CBS 11611]